MAARPEDVSIDDWKYLLEKFDSEVYQKACKRNAENRKKLEMKHSCGPRSFAEVEELTKDPTTQEKATPDEIWLAQHTKINKDGERTWSDPKSREIHEQLHELVVQNVTQEEPLTHDEMLLQVLGEKFGYFRGKGAGKKAPTKRNQEDISEEVEKSLRDFRETTLETMREKLRDEVRAELVEEVTAQVEKDVTERVTAQVQKDIEKKFDTMFANKMAMFWGNFPQSRTANSSQDDDT